MLVTEGPEELAHASGYCLTTMNAVVTAWLHVERDSVEDEAVAGGSLDIAKKGDA